MKDRGIKSTPCPIIRGQRALVNHGRGNGIPIPVHQELQTLPNHLLEVARDILGEHLDFTSLFDCLLASIIPPSTDFIPILDCIEKNLNRILMRAHVYKNRST